MDGEQVFIINGSIVTPTMETNLDINKSIFRNNPGFHKVTLDENERQKEESLCWKCIHREACETQCEFDYVYGKCRTHLEVMTPEEFESAMREIKEEHGDDPEVSHMLMDAVMVKLIESIGYNNGLDIYRNSDKFYA